MIAHHNLAHILMNGDDIFKVLFQLSRMKEILLIAPNFFEIDKRCLNFIKWAELVQDAAMANDLLTNEEEGEEGECDTNSSISKSLKALSNSSVHRQGGEEGSIELLENSEKPVNGKC